MASFVTEWKAAASRLANSAAGLTTQPNDFVFPETNFGDIALPCFKLAAILKKSPPEAAQEISEKINAQLDKNGLISRAEPAGPYVNFWLNRKVVSQHLLAAVTKRIFTYGRTKSLKQKILLEYVSPNTNKPYHLGHLRNAFIGWSLSKILENQGAKVIKAQIINDRGIHIMKSLLAYQKWGSGETPKSSGLKGDHLVGKYYVEFSRVAKDNSALDDEAQDLLRRWEAGDRRLKALCRKLNHWAMEGQAATAKRLGISFDRTDLESDIYKKGKKIALAALAADLLKRREDGAIVIDLDESAASGGRAEEKVVLRSDGTSVYITQDLALAKTRATKVKPNRMLYVVADEQNYYFNILFSTLHKLNLTPGIELKHINYHLVYLPEGKMKSREGTVVDTDNLLDELHGLAATEITKRQPDLSPREVVRRAEAVALAATKYYFLKVRNNSDIKFNPTESISFNGDTGPYLLYTYARAQSIFRKAGKLNRQKVKEYTLSDAAWQVVFRAARFPDIARRAAEDLDPSLVAEFSFQLAQAINDFYESEPILTAAPELATQRLKILKAATITLERSLNLLGISPLQEM